MNKTGIPYADFSWNPALDVPKKYRRDVITAGPMTCIQKDIKHTETGKSWVSSMPSRSLNYSSSPIG